MLQLKIVYTSPPAFWLAGVVDVLTEVRVILSVVTFIIDVIDTKRLTGTNFRLGIIGDLKAPGAFCAEPEFLSGGVELRLVPRAELTHPNRPAVRRPVTDEDDVDS
jgi:hypothetical protein